MNIIKVNDSIYGGNTISVEVTEEEYGVLYNSGDIDPEVCYYITDGNIETSEEIPAEKIIYNNEENLLEAETVQGAISELANKTANLSMEASKITFNKGEMEMNATTVEEALIEIWSELQLRALKSFEVVYMVDAGEGYKEEVQLGSTALLPTSFTPTKTGYTFMGWRKDNVASNEVLTECTVETSSLILWAVFKKSVTLTYSGNGAESGSVSAQTGNIYYNNGNVSNPQFTIPNVGFSKTNYSARGTWGTAEKGGTLYRPGDNISLSESFTLYAQWKFVKAEGSYSFYVDNSSQSGKVTFPDTFDTSPNISLNHVYGSFGDTLGKSSVTSKSTTGFSWSVTYGGRSTCTVYWTATN